MTAKTKLLLAFTCIFLASCKDRGKCLSQHTEFVFIPTWVTVCNGKICTPIQSGGQISPIEECDAWEFPEGRTK